MPAQALHSEVYARSRATSFILAAVTVSTVYLIFSNASLTGLRRNNEGLLRLTLKSLVGAVVLPVVHQAIRPR